MEGFCYVKEAEGIKKYVKKRYSKWDIEELEYQSYRRIKEYFMTHLQECKCLEDCQDMFRDYWHSIGLGRCLEQRLISRAYQRAMEEVCVHIVRKYKGNIELKESIEKI